MLKSILISFLFILTMAVPATLFGQSSSSTPKPPDPPSQQTISYQEAVAVWTEAQPVYWPILRMTLNDLLTAYFRDGAGEIMKIATRTYQVEMTGGGRIIILIDASF